MKAYRIIDREERNTTEELMLYTFSEVKKQFEPDKEELPDDWSRWNEAQDIEDLKEYFEWFYEGIEFLLALKRLRLTAWKNLSGQTTF